jgi:hypothetical protein
LSVKIRICASLNQMKSWREKFLAYYKLHETRFHIGFLMFGFVLDYFAAEKIDSPPVIIHQLFYLVSIAGLLTGQYLLDAKLVVLSKWQGLWKYQGLVLHFFLGTLLNLYSFFFFKSASVFTSIVFVLLLVALIAANEMPRFHKASINIKWALLVICTFSFFSMLFPKILGFVGWLPFLLSTVTTGLLFYLHFRWMMGKQGDRLHLMKAFLAPAAGVITAFVFLYFLGLIPPVPLATKNMGIYHGLEKRDGRYYLSHENPWWRFWQRGDQEFNAAPGDTLYVYAQIFSPANFNDEVVIHLLFKDPRQGWITADRIKMSISGGRQEGFRGFAKKTNFQEGSWRAQVETSDGSELGRLYFNIHIRNSLDPNRIFFQDVY